MNGLEYAMITGRVLPGDILLFQNGERGALNWLIRTIQTRALLDLEPTLKNDPAYQKLAKAASVYTHCAQVLSQTHFAEQYAPHARYRMFCEVPDDTVVMVNRLLDSDPDRLEPVLTHWIEVVHRREPYPIRELFYYWMKWGSKLAFSRKFATVFRDKKHNVCSGEVVHASQKGGWFENEPPEAWYPARLALAGSRTFSVGVIKV